MVDGQRHSTDIIRRPLLGSTSTSTSTSHVVGGYVDTSRHRDRRHPIIVIAAWRTPRSSVAGNSAGRPPPRPTHSKHFGQGCTGTFPHAPKKSDDGANAVPAELGAIHCRSGHGFVIMIGGHGFVVMIACARVWSASGQRWPAPMCAARAMHNSMRN